MEDAVRFMEEFLADEEIRNVYDKINDVEREAEERGIIKTAKNLLQLNIAIEDVSKATGLSIQELKNLELETILFFINLWLVYWNLIKNIVYLL